MVKDVKNAVKSVLYRPMRGRCRRLLSIGVSALLSAATFFAVIPQTETIVYADNDKTISGLCTGAIADSRLNPGTGRWSYVYYGTYGGNFVKYRVLNVRTSEFGGETMFLDCDSILDTQCFNDKNNYNNTWEISEIKTWLNGDGFLNKDGVFSTPEKNAIAKSYKYNPSSSDCNGHEELDFVPLYGEKIFLLDAKEATNLANGYQKTAGQSSTRSKSGAHMTWWWLRSRHNSNHDTVGYVDTKGDIYWYGVTIVQGVSPAFNIDLSSVIFSSVISGDPGKAGTEYKLTIADADLGIAPGTITKNGTTITVPYTITGSNAANATQVSVLIMDSEYSAGTRVTNGYTYLKLSGGVSGRGTFTLPEVYADKTCGTDYYAYILAEDVNAGNATDYASVPVSITIPDATTDQAATPTFTPVAGTYTEAQNVTISCTTTGATIHYTTDGSDPTSSRTVYKSPITVSETTTIRAIAVKDGMTDSQVAEATYTIEEPPTEYRTVTFDPNARDVRGKMDPQKIEKGKTEKLNENKFTREGFTFDSWNTKADGSGEKYADKASIMPQGDMTLYAQWKSIDPKPVSIKNAKVVLKSSKIGYNGKNRTPVVKTIKGLKLKEGTDYSVSVQNSKGKAVKTYKAPGKYTLVIKGKGNYTGSTKVGYEIVKGTNPLNVTAVKEKYNVPFSKIKKKDQTINKDKLFKFRKKGAGSITYSVSSAKKDKKSFKKFFSVSSKGKLTIKKGLKKGSYTVKVNVKAKGDKNYKSATKTVKFTVKVK
ncbi:MAG: chitobiase/beta-hexosaminidase C-terminal domain-containing protein [Lachnospiraceae bacterium]|nr:chitobiase/beta-hexosaminidase C-terminal domain-containing protein [Lachnospiraceae bacterium]